MKCRLPCALEDIKPSYDASRVGGSGKVSVERPSRQSDGGQGWQGSALVSAAQDPDPEPTAFGAKTPLYASPELFKNRVQEHLESICRSRFFESSKRCQQFLRYIVKETIEGRGGSIKERNIAYEVFGKGLDFEPGEDSLVRVKARELRKRLSEFYEAAPPKDLHIELPLGGYVPRIYDPSRPATPVHLEQESAREAPRSLERRKVLWMLSGSVGLLGAASAWELSELRRSPLDRLWQPVFATKTPLVIFMPILADRMSGELSDRVGIGPTAALRQAADFLDAHKYPYHLRFGADLTFAQLREQPSLLLGGFSSIWAQLMTRNLRFSLSWNEDFSHQAIIDTQTRQTWRPTNPTREGYADQDYGILCRLFDKDSGQIAMIAAGITTFGTEGAGSVFFNPVSFAELIKQAPQGWENKNFEAVIRVSVIETTPSFPQLVASYFW